MGSIGEEEHFDQMIRDYYESESNTPNNIPPIMMISSRPQSILQDILLEATDFEKQVRERVLMYIRNMGEPNVLKKWVVMRLQMDGYKASLCKTSWVSTFGSSKVFQYVGDYEYIEVMMNNKSGKPTRIIVDMEFRSQFEVARPTQTYKELITTLPSIFVATEVTLNKIISLVCSAAKESLKEKGLHIPPWRKAKYMQLKWFSKNCKKVSVSPNTEMGLQESLEKGTITTSTATTTCCPSIFQLRGNCN
ncbi:hypothetical protein P3X46_028471 [Hevea brasiliensis]|uniref:Uncharacterized protein n=2 Tax=Hevea brasiliensis TaxID=3981 RepID=A0A6A6KST5_HEVBR|nr:uncharacterized protein LOC110636020 [Hevea brasiliensis]KAF2291265.1 hypothetical protein GH714_021121 [Hevea brasiliensis]KAJ9146167.1 hypothetical protein P3X46_028471 [Hevea brasiliensis]